MEGASVTASRRSARRLVVPFGIAAVVIAVDQLSKWLVVDTLGPAATAHRFRLLGNAFAIHHVENTGVAFGFLQGQALLVTVLAILVVFFLVRMYRNARATSWTTAIACGLIVGGALGNLLDRVRLGYVVDFIEVSVWPKFNVADSAITIGALLLAWRYLRVEGTAGNRDLGRAGRSGLVALHHDGDR